MLRAGGGGGGGGGDGGLMTIEARGGLGERWEGAGEDEVGDGAGGGVPGFFSGLVWTLKVIQHPINRKQLHVF